MTKKRAILNYEVMEMDTSIRMLHPQGMRYSQQEAGVSQESSQN